MIFRQFLALSFLLIAFGFSSSCVSTSTPASSNQSAKAEIRRDSVELPDGRTLSYLVSGVSGGQRVIFVHGTPGESDNWEDLLERVPAGFEFISVDRLGFGKSTKDKPVVSLQEHAESLLPLLVKREGCRPVLAGHSYGGPVIARLAVDHPDKVGGVVMVAAALDPALEKIKIIQYVARWPLVRLVVPRMLAHCNEELIPLKSELLQLQPLLKQLSVPVAIVHGTCDKLVPFANVDFMHKTFPENTIIHQAILQGVGHFLPWNNYEEILSAVEVFYQ